MPRRQSLTAWISAHLHAVDGPDAGRPLKLEPWQRGLLRAIDVEGKPIVAVRAASQVGKTAIALGVGLRAAVDGRGVLLASATDTSIRDMARRLDATLGRSAGAQEAFPLAAVRTRCPRVVAGSPARRRRLDRNGGEWIAGAARQSNGRGRRGGRGVTLAAAGALT